MLQRFMSDIIPPNNIQDIDSSNKRPSQNLKESENNLSPVFNNEKSKREIDNQIAMVFK